MTLALGIDRSTGKLHGDANITYNDPFPCGSSHDQPAGSGFFGSGAMMGVVMHTMVGYMAGTISVFNNPANGASAHFGVGQDGRIHQFGPIGFGWCAWHASAANRTWYGAEFEDWTNPNSPISEAGLTAGAQLIEFLSRFADFPLQVSDSVGTKGFGYHAMGGLAWSPNGHTCPDLPPRHVRSAQRAEMIHRAHLIRQPAPTPPPSPVRLDADGHSTWSQLAARYGLRTEHLVWQTAMHAPNGFGSLEGPAVNELHDKIPPKGTVIWAGKYPAAGGTN